MLLAYNNDSVFLFFEYKMVFWGVTPSVVLTGGFYRYKVRDFRDLYDGMCRSS